MGTKIVGSEIVKEWLDRQEATIREAAKVAGVLDHRVTVGQAREFLVADVLRRFLPSMAEIGSGQILNSEGVLSKQVDIIVYDPRFPRFSVSREQALYLAEGVIAAIEVKTALGMSDVSVALDNAASVAPSGISVDADDLTRRIAAEVVRTRGEWSAVADEIGRAMMPRSYVFAFNSGLTPSDLITAVQKWVTGTKIVAVWDCRLPRVIAAGEICAVAKDRWASFGFEAEDQQAAEALGVGNSHAVMGCWRTSHRFGMLALNVAHAVIDRLGPLHGWHQIKYAPEAYLPAGLYSKEQADKESAFLWLHLTKSTPAEVHGWTIGRSISGSTER